LAQDVSKSRRLLPLDERRGRKATMMRASIWDIRELQKAPVSPRQKQANVGASLHSPRHGRVPPAARLSAIGRIALRERAAPTGPVLSSQLLYSGLAAASRAADSGPGRPWQASNARFPEHASASDPPPVSIPKVNPRKVLERISSPPTSARQGARSSSLPRTYQPPRRPPPLATVVGPGMPPQIPRCSTDTPRRSIGEAEPPQAVFSPAPGTTTALETDLGANCQPSPIGAPRSIGYRPSATSPASAPEDHSRPMPAGVHVPRAFSDHDLVLSLHMHKGDERRSSGPGLGAIQPHGRAQVLQQWSARAEPLPAAQRPPLAPTRQGSEMRFNMPPRTTATSSSAAMAIPQDSMDMEWSSLGEAARQALRQWVSGQLGGRHCMLVLEHGANAGNAAAPQEEELSTFDPRKAGALNVLSGLQAEFELVNGQGGWLFEAVFAKSPAEVLQEAFGAAAEALGELYQREGCRVPMEQANLALRRRALKCQAQVGQRTVPNGNQKRAADEYTQTQIWLELLRLHYDGAQQPTAAAKEKAAKERGPNWDDRVVLKELGKQEPEIEAESKQMSLETLRAQNRGIEDYVMRLVRQRDELRHATKLVEEQDSYFILGLAGPVASDDEVKKAYRQLAKREHPDKAGIGNKKRFQAIQHAYTSVLRQRKEGAAGGVLSSPRSGQKTEDEARPHSASMEEAVALTAKARAAADRVGIVAHRVVKAHEESIEAQALPKKRALGTLREITKQSASELQGASEALRQLGEAVCGVAACAEDAMNEHRDWASMTVAGVGLRDRAIIVDDAGRAATASGELLEKIVEATEATLRKVEKASPEHADPRQARDEVLNLIRLGVRLLGESIARTSAVARRSAEEALSAASKAVELGHGLVALEREVRKVASNQGQADPEVVISQEDGKATGVGTSTAAQGDTKADEQCQSAGAEGRENLSDDASDVGADEGKHGSPRKDLESATKRVKERHVALRVKNLRFLSSLNEEALRLQQRLRTLMLRSDGALLPEVSIPQKKWVFDLVTQLLDNALAESARYAEKNQSVAPARILERSFGFALALEHTQAIAMPADSRTQALRLAAMVDLKLLRDIIDGPFRKRLSAIGSKRTNCTSGSLASVARRGLPPSRDFSSGARVWEDSAQQLCSKVVKGLAVVSSACRRTDDDGHNGAAQQDTADCE